MSNTIKREIVKPSFHFENAKGSPGNTPACEIINVEYIVRHILRTVTKEATHAVADAVNTRVEDEEAIAHRIAAEIVLFSVIVEKTDEYLEKSIDSLDKYFSKLYIVKG